MSKVKAGVDSSSNANVEFYKSGESTAMVKMVNETNEFKIQKNINSSLVDIMEINEDGVVKFNKDVSFQGTNTILNTETLSIRDQTVEIGLSETNQVNSSGITKTIVNPGTTTFTTDSNNLTSGSSYILGGKSNSYPANVEISNYTPLSSYSLSGSGTTWTTSSTNELTPSNMNSSDMAFFDPNAYSNTNSQYNSVSPGSFNSSNGELSLRLNYNTNLYNMLNALTVNTDLVKFSSTNTSGTFFDNLLGRLINLGLDNENSPTIMYVTLKYDTNNSSYSLSSYSLPSNPAEASLKGYPLKTSISSTSYTAGTNGYVFTLTDSNLSNPYSANEYIFLNNCSLSDGTQIFNTSNRVASVSGSTITIESSTDYNVSNISDSGNIYMSKLSSITNNTGLCIVGQNSGAFVDACLKYDSNLHLQLENNSGKIKIGSDNIAQNITIGEAGSRQVNIGSASASNITVDTGSSISLDAVSASNFTTGSGSLTLNGAGGLTLVGGSNSTNTVTGTYDIDTTGALSLNSSADVINIGDDAVNQNINIGTGGTRTINLGNNTSTIYIPGGITLGGQLSTDTISGPSVTVYGSSTSVDIDATTTVDIDGITGINIGANNTSTIDMNATSLAIDSTDTTNLTMTANAGSTKTMTISASNSDGSNVADLDIDADGTITLDGASGITIGGTNASNLTLTATATDINTTSLDIDASGALTLDSATSISIGANADVPMDIDASTLSIDASNTTYFRTTGASMTISTINSGNMIQSSAGTYDLDVSGDLSINSSGGVINIGNDDISQNINIGTNGTRTITVGKDGVGTFQVDSENVVFTNSTQFSDIRLKENFLSIENPLEKVSNLNGYYYNLIKDENKKTNIGFIAQEVETQFPMLITNQENGYKSVNYIGMIPVLLECIKDLQKQINDLKK